jgi:hypothetical protein
MKQLFKYVLITSSSVLLGWFARKQTTTYLSDFRVETAGEPTKAANFPATNQRTAFCLELARTLPNANAADCRKHPLQVLARWPDDEKIWRALFKGWFDRNALEAWSFVTSQIDREAFPTIYHLAISTWAAIDPKAASLELRSTSSHEKLALLKSILIADPVLGLTLLDSWDFEKLVAESKTKRIPWSKWMFKLGQNPSIQLPEFVPSDSVTFLGAYLAGLASRDHAVALKWLNERANRDEILDEMDDFLRYSDDYDPKIIDFFSSRFLKGNRRLEEMSWVLRSLAYRDHDLAVSETIRLFPDHHQQAEILAIIAEGLARRDFDAAWKLICQVDSSIQSLRRVSIPSVELTEGKKTRKERGPTSYAWDLTSMRGLVNPATLRGDLLTKIFMVDRESALKHLSELPKEDLPLIGGRGFER